MALQLIEISSASSCRQQKTQVKAAPQNKESSWCIMYWKSEVGNLRGWSSNPQGPKLSLSFLSALSGVSFTLYLHSLCSLEAVGHLAPLRTFLEPPSTLPLSLIGPKWGAHSIGSKPITGQAIGMNFRPLGSALELRSRPQPHCCLSVRVEEPVCCSLILVRGQPWSVVYWEHRVILSIVSAERCLQSPKPSIHSSGLLGPDLG